MREYCFGDLGEYLVVLSVLGSEKRSALMLITMMMMVNDSDYIDLLGSARAAKLQANHLWAHSALVVTQIQKQ